MAHKAGKSGRSETPNEPRRVRRAAVRRFSPVRGILLLSQGEIVSVPTDQMSPDLAGWKAYGLSCLPLEWVPPFFVIENKSIGSRAEYSALAAQISECMSRLGFGRAGVFVRSSGTSETIEQRGRLVSEACSGSEVLSTIQRLSENLSVADTGNVNWIVQEYIQPVRKGHLSNERRLSREPRDFVVEFELSGDRPGYTVPVGVRHWRDGATVRDFDLSSTSEHAVTLKLRPVALWATALSTRVLFEWVWSGTRVWIVQADIARPKRGVNPRTLLGGEVLEVESKSLLLFRLAEPSDFEKYGKLRNARTYEEIGYKMPVFYVLDDQSVIQRLLRAEIPEQVEPDLEILTKRPLIIRTDGIGIPKEKREMLPRSEGLCNENDGKKWLVDQFAKEIDRIGIANCSLCLIAHHFIPSVAAAGPEPSQKGALSGLSPSGAYQRDSTGTPMTHSKLTPRTTIRSEKDFDSRARLSPLLKMANGCSTRLQLRSIGGEASFRRNGCRRSLQRRSLSQNTTSIRLQ